MPKPVYLQSLILASDDEFDVASQHIQEALVNGARREVFTNFEAVRATYEHLQALPTFLSMTPESRVRVLKYIEESPMYSDALVYTPELATEYDDMIDYLLQSTCYVRTTTRLPSYNTHSGEPHEIRTESKLTKRPFTIISSTHSALFNGSLVLKECIITRIIDVVGKLRVIAIKQCATPYQVVLTTTEGHPVYYSIAPGELQKGLEHLVDRYNGSFCVDTITVHAIHERHQDSMPHYIDMEELCRTGIPYEISTRDILEVIRQ
jgi:hypothetical protein